MPFEPDSKAQKTDARLDDLKLQEEEELAQLLADRYGFQYVDLTGVSINTDALRLVPEERARIANVAPFKRIDKKLAVAIQSPNQEYTKNEIKELVDRGYTVEVYVVSKRSLERAWERYKDVSFATETKAGTLDISNEDIIKTINEVKSIDDAKAKINEIMLMKKAFRISRIVETILACSIATKSSDVHIEPEEKYVRVRFRIDGILTDMLIFDFETYHLLLSRIKLLSGIKLNIKENAQDGRFSIVVDQREIEIRTSTLPGNYGESIVMRLLDPASLGIPLEVLGIEPDLLELIKKEIARPNGMILNTGPTGSGKTTTLYAFLARNKNPGVKIITIEDPIEYHLEGIVQTQVDVRKGYTFESGLKSALRQDPDVIMVGEIRDKDTAETAIHASLTGHLVYSTLHTNTAAGAFPRLVDMGVNPKVIGSAINVVIAQRLVRKLCPKCRKEIPIPPDKKPALEKILNSLLSIKPDFEFKTLPDHIYAPGTCPECGNIGYKGRLGVFEVVLMNKKIDETIKENPSEREIATAAREQKIPTMEEDGLMKILRGVTSLEEVERVVDLYGNEI